MYIEDIFSLFLCSGRCSYCKFGTNLRVAWEKKIWLYVEPTDFIAVCLFVFQLGGRGISSLTTNMPV